MNLKLKLALTAYPAQAYTIAQKIGIHHSTLSKIVSEIQQPTEEQKEKLAKILGKTVEELFDG